MTQAMSTTLGGARRVRWAQIIGAAALLAATALVLPSAYAADGIGADHGADHGAAGHSTADHGAAGHSTAGHDAAGHDAAAHKEHLRHFSLVNLLLSEHAEQGLRRKLAVSPKLEKSFIDREDFVGHGHLAHVVWAAIAALILLGLAYAARARLRVDADAGVLPQTSINPVLFFEIIVGAVWSLMVGMMPKHEARRYFPMVATCAVFILTMNLLALLPLGAPATDNLNTNIGMGLTIFFATHYAGIRSQGLVHYAQHFMGPVLALAPLMVVIEIVGHLVRPLSLSLRLMGNMTGDHNVLFEFTYFKLPLVPLPVMFLGLMVCVVQTVVFVMLSTVYLSMATAGGHDEAHGH